MDERAFIRPFPIDGVQQYVLLVVRIDPSPSHWYAGVKGVPLSRRVEGVYKSWPLGVQAGRFISGI